MMAARRWFISRISVRTCQFLMSLGTSQGFGLFVGVGADVLPLASAVVLGRVDEVEIARLTVAVFAPVGGSQDGLESSSSLSSKVCGTGK